jgi:hypothetical protein
VGGCLIQNATGVIHAGRKKMRRRIKLTTRKELTAAIRERYHGADRMGKKVILDEFTQVSGYHRKHAIRVLTTPPTDESKTGSVRRVYQQAVKEALIVLWRRRTAFAANG